MKDAGSPPCTLLDRRLLAVRMIVRLVNIVRLNTHHRHDTIIPALGEQGFDVSFGGFAVGLGRSNSLSEARNLRKLIRAAPTCPPRPVPRPLRSATPAAPRDTERIKILGNVSQK